MAKNQAARQLDESRQGFVGYVHLDGLQWRVMLRLRLEDEVWWRGRLWFTENGGTEVWDKEEMLGRSPEALLRQGRSLSQDDLSRRFRASYDERRRYFGLRAMLDDLLEKARGMNRVAMRVAAGEVDRRRARAELDQLQQEMAALVEGMRDIAGIEGRR